MNKINKTFLLLVLCTTTAFYGQRKENHEKIKSLKVAFITEKLDLSSVEAQTFWPIYNDYQEKRAALRKKERTEVKSKVKEVNQLSENEAVALLEKHINLKNEKEALHKAFIKSVNKKISAKKTLLLLRAEEEFKRQLIKQYRHKKGSNSRK